MKKLVFENLDQITEYSFHVNDGMKNCNELAAEFNKLGLKKIENPAQVVAMINDIDQFITTMLPESTPVQLFGITLKPAKIVELMELDLTEIKKRIKELKGTPFAHRNIGMFTEVAMTAKGKSFEVDPNKMAAQIEKYKVYALSDREHSILSGYEKIIAGFSELANVVGFQRLTEQSIRDLFDLRGQKFAPSPAFWHQCTR